MPFYFTGCEKVEVATQPIDSTATLKSDGNSKDKQYSSNFKAHTDLDTSRSDIGSDKDTPAHKLSAKYAWLRPILIPKENTYTGLGTLINIYQVISMFALGFSMFLLLLAIILKLLNQARHIAWFHSLLSLLFLFIARPISFKCELLWGYWLCIATLVLLLIHDGLGLKQKSRQNF